MMALVSGGRSKLNPDAPLFIPAAFRQVEDFSPEWWELVKTSTWFRDYWLEQHQEESFDINAEDDVVNLLPDSFDLGIGEEDFANFEDQIEDLVQSSKSEVVDESTLFAKKDATRNGLEMNAEALMKNLSLLKSPSEVSPKYAIEPAKYREKPAQYVSPKCSPRRINQPR